jgi:hypothetical protein
MSQEPGGTRFGFRAMVPATKTDRFDSAENPWREGNTERKSPWYMDPSLDAQSVIWSGQNKMELDLLTDVADEIPFPESMRLTTYCTMSVKHLFLEIPPGLVRLAFYASMGSFA